MDEQELQLKLAVCTAPSINWHRTKVVNEKLLKVGPTVVSAFHTELDNLGIQV